VRKVRSIPAVVAAVLCACAIGGAAAVAVGLPAPVLPEPEPWVLASGDTVAVTRAGSGPPVVIVPGMLGGAHSFRHVTAQLSRAGRNVVVVEPLGTGASGRAKGGDYSLTAHAARTAEVLDGLGVRGAVVVCHSLGSSIALRLAASRPDLVTRVVSINGGLAERAGTDGLRSALRFAPMIRVAGSGLARRHIRSGLVNSSADPAWVTDDVVLAYTRSHSEDFGGVLRVLRGYADAVEPDSMAPRLAQVRAPMHLLIGAAPGNDGVPAAEIATLERLLPGFSRESVTGAGSYIQEERPEVVVDAVLRPRPARP
jgi:pimeloyl-ACP methyl ester carboxylesterase